MKIINIMASSLDGRIGAEAIEGDKARQEVGVSGKADYQRLLAEMRMADAILVGASSIRANQVCLDHWGGPSQNSDLQYPHWYIFATKPIPSEYTFWGQTHIPRTIMSRDKIDQTQVVASQQIENLCYGDTKPAQFAVEALQMRGHRRVLLFGGGIINSWFYEGSFVNELKLTLAPVFIGHRQAPYLIEPDLSHIVNLKLLSCEQQDGFLFVHYQVS